MTILEYSRFKSQKQVCVDKMYVGKICVKKNTRCIAVTQNGTKCKRRCPDKFCYQHTIVKLLDDARVVQDEINNIELELNLKLTKLQNLQHELDTFVNKCTPKKESKIEESKDDESDESDESGESGESGESDKSDDSSLSSNEFPLFENENDIDIKSNTCIYNLCNAVFIIICNMFAWFVCICYYSQLYDNDNDIYMIENLTLIN